MKYYKNSIKVVKDRSFLHLRLTCNRKRSILCTKNPIYLININSLQDELDKISNLCSYKNVHEFKEYFKKNFLKDVLEKNKIKPIESKKHSSLNSIYNETKKRAKKKNLEFNINLEYLNDLYLLQNKRCYISGYELSLEKKNLYKLSIDRINNDLGYIVGNIQLICLGINYLKNTFSNTEVLEFLKNINNDK